MAIKLIVSDVDGTLLDHSGKYHKRTLAGIKKATDAGIIVTLGTGRSFATARPLQKELGMSGPIVGLNGAVIKDPFITYKSHFVEDEAIAQAAHFAAEFDAAVYFFVGDEIYLLESDKKAMEEVYRKLAINAELEYFHGMSSMEEMITVATGHTNKVVFVDISAKIEQNSAKIETARQILAERMEQGAFTKNVDVTSSFFNNMELMPQGVNKGTGVSELAAALGFMPEEVMCIGDNENDLDMFAYAGESYAMGNASDLVKGAAKHVALPVNEGGVGAAIEEVLARQ